jgi:hypothetical protein
MSAMTWDEYRERMLTGIRSVLTEDWTRPDDEARSVVLGVAQDGRVRVLALPEDVTVDAVRTREWLRQALPHEARRLGLQRLTFVTQAWRAPHQDGAIPPSQHPERQEIVLVVIAGAGRVETWSGAVDRSPNLPPALGPWQEGGPAEGRVLDLVTAALQQ